MEVVGNFKEDRYAIAKGLIPKDLCAVATKYALIKNEWFRQPEDAVTGQIPDTHSVYGDTLMETLMYFMHPHMQNVTGKKLCPTYAYYRVYKPQDELKRHSDRPSCEISTTVCLGYNYKGVEEGYNWGMYVDGESNHQHSTPFVSDERPGILYHQEPGDCIVYTGTELEHWRDPFEAGEGSYQVQVFMHYIDMDGPFYPEFAYDKRPALGAPIQTKRND